MKKRITVIFGDGIGIGVTHEAVKGLETVAQMGGHQFETVEFDWGGGTLPTRRRVTAGRGARDAVARVRCRVAGGAGRSSRPLT